MSTQLQIASARLFGPGGLNVKNFHMFPGSRPNVSAEEIAGQINIALDAIETGDFELVSGD